jgi:uncharacterized protein (DUF1697 family)
MPVFISMLRGVNVGGHNRIKMEALRALFDSLGLKDSQTLIQSGNVVFRTKERNPALLIKHIGDGIEKSFGFRCGVVLRSTSQLRASLSRNPFASRKNLDPSRLLISFLAAEPDAEASKKIAEIKIKITPEELHLAGCELFIYSPDGLGKSKLPLPAIEKALKTFGTGRNLNTVRKLLAIAEGLEALP